IARVNSQVVRVFGYKEEELVGVSIEMLLAHRFREGHGEQKGMMSGMVPCCRRMGAHQELYGVRKDGCEFPMEVVLSPLPWGGDEMVLAAITDHTGRKDSEQYIIDIGVQLLEANEQIRKMKEQLECEN